MFGNEELQIRIIVFVARGIPLLIVFHSFCSVERRSGLPSIGSRACLSEGDGDRMDSIMITVFGYVSRDESPYSMGVQGMSKMGMDSLQNVTLWTGMVCFSKFSSILC